MSTDCRLSDLDGGRAGIEQWHLRLLDDRHDGERRVRTLFADDDVRLELLNQALGRLCRRQRPAARIFILNSELISVHARLIELLQREFDTLFVLRTEIGAWS